MFDMKHLAKLLQLHELTPEGYGGFLPFDPAFRGGAISVKHKALIAVAVALITQCPTCVVLHSQRAREAGASERELAETAVLAAALCAAAALPRGTRVLR